MMGEISVGGIGLRTWVSVESLFHNQMCIASIDYTPNDDVRSFVISVSFLHGLSISFIVTQSSNLQRPTEPFLVANSLLLGKSVGKQLPLIGFKFELISCFLLSLHCLREVHFLYCSIIFSCNYALSFFSFLC